MMKYGDKPTVIEKDVKCLTQEMFLYQYLPIKLNDSLRYNPIMEKRLQYPFTDLVNRCVWDFCENFGESLYKKQYVYLTAKRIYCDKNQHFNREGWHCDGFLTQDINYIWCDKNPTIFNNSKFNLTLDDQLSMKEMELQALPENNFSYKAGTLLRLNQFNVHKVDENSDSGIRTFVKVSFSKDKYDLKGNSHNYELDYHWTMRERALERNIPQKI